MVTGVEGGSALTQRMSYYGKLEVQSRLHPIRPLLPSPSMIPGGAAYLERRSARGPAEPRTLLSGNPHSVMIESESSCATS